MSSDEENINRKSSAPREAIGPGDTVVTNTEEHLKLQLDIDTVLELVADAAVIVDPNGIIKAVNIQLVECSGYVASELVGQSVEMLLPRQLLESHARYRNSFSIKSLARSMDVSKVTLGMHCKDGTEMPCDIDLSPLKTLHGKYTLTNIRDLSELKKVQQRLSEKESSYQQLLKTTNAIPWEANARTWLFTYVGAQVERLMGFTRDQWKEKDFWINHIHPDDRAQTVRYCEQSSRKLDHYEFEYRMINAHGQVVWIHDVAQVFRVDGEPSMLRGFMIDVTEAKSLSRKLRIANAEASNLIGCIKGLSSSAPNGLYYLDAELRFVEINKYLADNNYPPIDKYLIENTTEFVSDIVGVESKVLEMIRGELPTVEARSTGATSGKRNPQRVFSYNPVTLDDGKLARIDGIENDVTKRSGPEYDKASLLKKTPPLHQHDDILGRSAPILDVLKLIEQVAPTNANVLLIGDTGTGKELMAREVHKLSLRTKRPMITVNCAALPATLIESELFGREKGAFTGALAKSLGRFEMADDATLFLDEIGELPLELQPKLLRVLQEGEFERLGGVKTVKVDVRIVAATNRNLEEMVAEGLFRSDLYYRLSAFPIAIPPLRDLSEDIPELVWSFVNEFADTMGKRIDTIRESTMQNLQNYQWPGNVRELRNVIERAMILSSSRELEVVLPASPKSPSDSESMQLKDVEKSHILRILDETDWRIRGEEGAALILGLKPSTLESRMSKLGINRK